MHNIFSKDTPAQVEALRRSNGAFTYVIIVHLDDHFTGIIIGSEPDSIEWKRNIFKEDWKVAFEIISENKIKWAIKSFMLFKSSGTDGNFFCTARNRNNVFERYIMQNI